MVWGSVGVGGVGIGVDVDVETHGRASLQGRATLLSSLRVIARHEAIHLCQIYGRFISKKTSISFPANYPTANDYSRLQTFNQQVDLDKRCTFATQSKGCSTIIDRLFR